MVKLKNLVSNGYFPKELPPPFSTLNLAQHIDEIEKNLGEFSKRKSICAQFTIPRIKEIRRYLKVPNPLHQIILSKSIADNWNELSNFFDDSNISLSTPVIGDDSERCISPKYSYPELIKQKILKSYASRYLLKLDLSRYYHTIYTHSIPWPYHEKAFAKKKRQSKYLGNEIDKNVRNTQDQQTFGIPVGPDTSLVISEIIGTKIDKSLQDEFDNLIGLRYIDDFYLYFPDLVNAENCYTYLSRILRDYELEENTAKTDIIELPEQIEQKWVSDLRLHKFREKSTKDIIDYFSKTFMYSKKYKDEYVIKYAVSRIKNYKFNEDDWNLYESLLLKSIFEEPSVLPIVLEIFLAYRELGYSLNYDKIETAINKFLLYHSNYNHNFEVSWALWIAKSLSLSIYLKTSSKISKIDNPFIALLTLDLNNSGLIKGELDEKLWKSHMISGELYEKNWILAYEAYIKSWLSSKSGKDYISSNDFFDYMKSNDISFYDTENQIKFKKPKERRLKYKQIEEDYHDSQDNENLYFEVAAFVTGYK